MVEIKRYEEIFCQNRNVLIYKYTDFDISDNCMKEKMNYICISVCYLDQNGLRLFDV